MPPPRRVPTAGCINVSDCPSVCLSAHHGYTSDLIIKKTWFKKNLLVDFFFIPDPGIQWARSYMFSVQNYRYPMHLFSEQVLGTYIYAFRLRDHWIVLVGTIAFRFVIGTIHGLRSLTSTHYTAQRENSLVGMIDRLTLSHNARSPQLCTKPRPLEHVLGTTAFRLRFGGVLRGVICSENMFWPCSSWNCSGGNSSSWNPFRIQEMVCTENMFREYVPAGTVPRTSVNARYEV